MSWDGRRTAREIWALKRQAPASWYKIQNKKATDEPTQILIYDEIGFCGINAQEFVSELSSIKGPIDLHLNSPGGGVIDGIAIYNALKRHGELTITVDSMAASIASVIAMAADPGQLLMEEHSQMMVHDGWGMTVGNAADMRKTAEILDQQSDNIAGIYASRTGKDASFWRDVMRNETWYIDQEAVDAGLADQVIGVTSTKNALPAAPMPNTAPVGSAQVQAPESEPANQEVNDLAALAAVLRKVG